VPNCPWASCDEIESLVSLFASIDQCIELLLPSIDPSNCSLRLISPSGLPAAASIKTLHIEIGSEWLSGPVRAAEYGDLCGGLTRLTTHDSRLTTHLMTGSPLGPSTTRLSLLDRSRPIHRKTDVSRDMPTKSLPCRPDPSKSVILKTACWRDERQIDDTGQCKSMQVNARFER